MSEFVLKNYYEKFCFLNHYPEKKLSDYVHLFEGYGYTLEKDKKSLAFGKLIEKKNISVPARDELLTKNSLDAFFDIYYQRSSLESDSIFFDEFSQNYKEF